MLKRSGLRWLYALLCQKAPSLFEMRLLNKSDEGKRIKSEHLHGVLRGSWNVPMVLLQRI
jgi:hypothetical protein